MIKQPLLYYCTKDQNYYIKKESKCDNCHQDLQWGDAFFIVSEYKKRLSTHKIFCVECTRKYKKMGNISEYRQGFIAKTTDIVTPVILHKPKLGNYNGDDVFSAATKHHNQNVKIIDKTRYAIQNKTFVDNLIQNNHPKKLGQRKVGKRR